MKNDIDALLDSIFSNGKLRLNNAVRNTPEETGSAAEALQKNMDEIAALNENVRAELEKMDRQIQADGLSESANQKKKGYGEAPSSHSPAEVFETLEEQIGREIIGQDAFVRDVVRAFERPYFLGEENGSPAGVIVLCGKCGTGRRTALACLADALCNGGVWGCGEIIRLDLSLYPTVNEQKLFLQDLYTALQGKERILLFENTEQAAHAVLTMVGELVQKGKLELTSRYALQKGMLVDVGTALVPQAVKELSCKGKFLVFRTEKTEQSLASLFGTGFLRCVSTVCRTEAFAPQALEQLAKRELERISSQAQSRMKLTVDTTEDAVLQLAAAFQPNTGVPSITQAADRVYAAIGEYKLENRSAEQLTLAVENNEFVLRLPEDTLPVRTLLKTGYDGDMEDARAQLDAVVGLEEVKEFVLSLEESCRVNAMRRARGLKSSPVSMHMIFAGNPGTGKTTIARLVSRYLKAAGALSEGHLVEVSRGDLVGKYVGHTAPLTMQAVRSALGGVLFIDEAYSLCRGKDDTFGLEAIDTLVKAMEDHRENLVVILAGYSKEMGNFLQANSGLRSRFPNYIEFPDYTGEELTRIAQSIAASKGYRIDADCIDALTRYFTAVQAVEARTAGNGRLARNVVEDAILHQARRVLKETEPDLELLLPQDFAEKLGEME